MAKFSGNIGFVKTVEDSENPGVWKEETVEKHYTGDLVRVTRRTQTQQNSVNDNITLSNEISIVVNPYLQENMFAMRYVVFMGAKWKITTVDASQYPRLILTVGGVYNG